MKIANNVAELIGNTPLVRINNIIDTANIVAAKLESFNPAGSLKDRAAYNMIKEAEREGDLKPGGTIIEATSGNTGISLAFIAAAFGYKCIIVMPEDVNIERLNILKIYGVEVILTNKDGGMKGAIEKAKELKSKIKDAFLVGQFNNPSNPKIHELTTAKEIIEDTDGKVNVVVAGIGTGGTITGIGRRLKAYNPLIKIIGVEPSSSAVLNGGRPGPHSIQGIGAGFKPDILDMTVIDDVITVTDEEAYFWTKNIIRKEGLFVGISSGAAACATYKYLMKEKLNNSLIVVIFPDTAERYLSIHNLRDNKG